MDKKTPYERFLEATSYEDFVKATYDALISQDIGVVHSKKHYQGKKTGHDHEIDVSIELNVADLDILILIECKHYKSRVEIGDLLEFAQRIDDIGAHKGVLVSTIGFQEGAIKVAEGYGIALVTTAPVWQTIKHHVNEKGECDAFFMGDYYVGTGFGRDKFVGVTVVSLNDSIRREAGFEDAWKVIINFLSGTTKCEDCGKFIKRLPNRASNNASQALCDECFLLKHSCNSCGKTNIGVAKGLCEDCFYLNLELKCPSCGKPIKNIIKGVCQKCFAKISEALFEGGRWYKCLCKQMIHITDLDSRAAKCECGYIIKYSSLKYGFK